VQTNVLIKEEFILKNKNKSCAYKKLSVFYNSCLKTFGSHLVSVNMTYHWVLRFDGICVCQHDLLIFDDRRICQHDLSVGTDI
jgi:hypothetical protein